MVGLRGVKLPHTFLQCIHHSVLIHSHTRNKIAYLVFLRNYINKIQLKTRHWICILWSINEILWSEIKKGGEENQIYTEIEKLSKQKIRQWRILVFSMLTILLPLFFQTYDPKRSMSTTRKVWSDTSALPPNKKYQVKLSALSFVKKDSSRSTWQFTSVFFPFMLIL